MVFNLLTNVADHSIPHIMTISIIDLFEVIDIQHGNG
ncbi:Uncharacterised protein [Vibrio cholerae]|uniref:Uncharacterized protein n=1 Tax=Vibrio cholerae TaxID=666 RepID=A0A655UHY2_VIBCL|nr:Uncharacterised protein [Vibrio cholerae]CSB41616.1 Uncharacterised protein [Vibrio cholerae]CSB51236.1 Uncharacterised protein [Vibrio cholerae]CSC39002.1 Uncharacterised protein [Vibrio cholerae]CSD33060.1 Uncharacterised protein [Vibrio cholerae]